MGVEGWGWDKWRNPHFVHGWPRPSTDFQACNRAMGVAMSLICLLNLSSRDGPVQYFLVLSCFVFALAARPVPGRARVLFHKCLHDAL
jgi:hypothetical protein